VARARPGAALNSPLRKRIVWIAVAVVVLVAMALSTKVVGINSRAGAAPGTFSPTAYASTAFPKIQKAVIAKAVDASTLAAAIAASPTAAGKRYGVRQESGMYDFAVKFTGKAAKPDSGIYPVTLTPSPKKKVLVRVQAGPAINGTELRDATGTIKFPQFTNQIDYQNAGQAINDQMKKLVLAKLDAAHLQGKTVTVTGVFQLVNPAAWLVTPVQMSAR